MTGMQWLADRFAEHRSHLRAVAHRMLGSAADAEDAVQEAWMRLSRSDASRVDNLVGWLTTVVARICLDMLRSRETRREEPLEHTAPEPPAAHREGDPEAELALADSVGPALLVVLETLGPAERVAFVLHDMFDLPFEEIAPIVGRTPALPPRARVTSMRCWRSLRRTSCSRSTTLPSRSHRPTGGAERQVSRA